MSNNTQIMFNSDQRNPMKIKDTVSPKTWKK